MGTKAQVVLLSGFLGAGKTTTMIGAARKLEAQGKKVAIVTNDQGKVLIDTELGRSNGLMTEEVVGGCFCCRFDDLHNILNSLQKNQQPDVIIAEAVGSCADLAATVIQPLQQYYGNDFETAPLTVIVDPLRLFAGVLSGHTETFSAAIRYIYEQQIAEADIIALNKVDKYSKSEMDTLATILRSRYPAAIVQPLSAERGDHLDALIDLWMNSATSGSKILDIDYAQYAEGEAKLAWLNLMGDVAATVTIDARKWVAAFLNELEVQFIIKKMAVAHLKVYLGNDTGFVKASIVQADDQPTFTFKGQTAAASFRLVLNIRIEADPEQLNQVVAATLATVNSEFKLVLEETYNECFRPAPPVPKHRLQVGHMG